MKNKKIKKAKANDVVATKAPKVNDCIRRFEPMRLTKKGKLKFMKSDLFLESYDSYDQVATDLKTYVENDTSKRASEKNYVIVELFHS